jgi:Tfp pilus assembly protein PilO
MRSNYKVNAGALRDGLKEPRVFLRVILGLLLLANVVAAALVFKPWAGSAEDLERRAADLRRQVHEQQASLDHLRTVVNKVKAARADGDKFLDTYMLSRKTAAPNLLGELNEISRQAGIRQAETTEQLEPIEGSDSLSKVTISANYQGTYADLVKLLNLLDRSPRFLVVESLRAAPQQASQVLNITMRLDAFVREGGPDQQVAIAGEQAPAQPRPAAQGQAAPVNLPQAAPAAQAQQVPPVAPGRDFLPAVPVNQPPVTPPLRRGFSERKQVRR